MNWVSFLIVVWLILSLFQLSFLATFESIIYLGSRIIIHLVLWLLGPLIVCRLFLIFLIVNLGCSLVPGMSIEWNNPEFPGSARPRGTVGASLRILHHLHDAYEFDIVGCAVLGYFVKSPLVQNQVQINLANPRNLWHFLDKRLESPGFLCGTLHRIS